MDTYWIDQYYRIKLFMEFGAPLIVVISVAIVFAIAFLNEKIRRFRRYLFLRFALLRCEVDECNKHTWNGSVKMVKEYNMKEGKWENYKYEQFLTQEERFRVYDKIPEYVTWW